MNLDLLHVLQQPRSPYVFFLVRSGVGLPLHGVFCRQATQNVVKYMSLADMVAFDPGSGLVGRSSVGYDGKPRANG